MQKTKWSEINLALICLWRAVPLTEYIAAGFSFSSIFMVHLFLRTILLINLFGKILYGPEKTRLEKCYISWQLDQGGHQTSRKPIIQSFITLLSKRCSKMNSNKFLPPLY